MRHNYWACAPQLETQCAGACTPQLEWSPHDALRPDTAIHIYIHTYIFFKKKRKKRNELSSHEKTWRNFKCILLSERSQPEKATYYTIPTMSHSGKGKTMETIKRSVVARGRREGWTGQARRILGQWNYSEWYYNGRYMTLCTCQNPGTIPKREP